MSSTSLGCRRASAPRAEIASKLRRASTPGIAATSATSRAMSSRFSRERCETTPATASTRARPIPSGLKPARLVHREASPASQDGPLVRAVRSSRATSSRTRAARLVGATATGNMPKRPSRASSASNSTCCSEVRVPKFCPSAMDAADDDDADDVADVGFPRLRRPFQTDSLQAAGSRPGFGRGFIKSSSGKTAL